MSEFAEYHTWLFRVDNNETEVADILQSLPKGAKIVHRKLMKLGDVRVGEVQGKKLRSGVEQHEMIEKISFGIPREPEDFVREAVRAGHPRFLDYKSIEHVDVLIQRNLNTDLKKVVKERNAWLKKWTDRARQLQSEENKLHDSLKPHCATVLKGKRLLLFGDA